MPPRDHDGFVIAAHRAAHFLFKSAEVTGEIRAAEFVVERRAANRPVDHDLQGRGRCDPACRIRLPRAEPRRECAGWRR